MRRCVLRLFAGPIVLLSVWGAASTSAAGGAPPHTVPGASGGVAAGGGSATFHPGGPHAVPGRYLVGLHETRVPAHRLTAAAAALAARYGGTVAHTYRHAIHGFLARLDADAARAMSADPSVRYVAADEWVHLAGDPRSWGQDRVDQRALPLDKSYAPGSAGEVTMYVMDTGARATHQELKGRIVPGIDVVDNDNDPQDCNGHGTFVAGVITGATTGLTRDAAVTAVRVMNCGGGGLWANIAKAMDWMIEHHPDGKPAVANMSLASPRNPAGDEPVRKAIADGIIMVIAAGNDNGKDACKVSPAGVTEAITVGATSRDDKRWTGSNTGACLDLFAPGNGIAGPWHKTDDQIVGGTGTSFAAPHVAAAALMLLNKEPALTQAQVEQRLVQAATPDVVTDPKGSPNRHLYLPPPG